MISDATTHTMQPLLAELQQQAHSYYGQRLAGLILFGSQARGDAVLGSDIDVLVVLHGKEQQTDRAFSRDLTHQLLLRYDMLASLLHIPFDQYLYEQSPLMINVRREGVVLTNGEMKPLLHTTMLQSRGKREGISPEGQETHMTNEQAELIEKAVQNLRGARLMESEGLYGFAASRAYYTMFYVAQALLLTKGMAFSKHSAVIAAFGKHVAHTGIVPVEFHRYLIDAQEARMIGDYASKEQLTEGDTETLLARAEAFLDFVDQVLGVRC